LREPAATLAGQQASVDIGRRWIGYLSVKFLKEFPPIEDGQFSAAAAIGEDQLTQGVVEDIVDEDCPAILAFALRVHNLPPDLSPKKLGTRTRPPPNADWTGCQTQEKQQPAFSMPLLDASDKRRSSQVNGQTVAFRGTPYRG
jgi:hypothetical protein